ncbi:PEGA domain-containing protein [Corallococcus sp. H22C18031201]|nr:PEGA domain-containing protein [Corallococcus sp. H22C18031201]
MILRRVVLSLLVAALAVPSSAFAQDDDLIEPLGPQPTKTSRTKKSKAVRTPRPPKTRAPKKERTATRKGQSVKPSAAPTQGEDDLIAPLVPVKTELVLKLGTNARGAKLFLDGKEVTAGSGPLAVTPGETHTVVARRSGYAEYSERVVVEEGKSSELVVALDAVVGFATVTADVSRATVLLDGVEMGTTPISNMQLKPGTREFEFRAKDLKDVQHITVRAGQQYVVEGKLRPVSVADASDQPRNPVLIPERTRVDQPGLALNPQSQEPEPVVSTSKSWYQRWYVWAGVGLVAAASVGAVMATQNNAKPLAPNEVCGVNCDGVIPAAARPAALPSGGGLRF